jgi:antitoxin ParD1/3/4
VTLGRQQASLDDRLASGAYESASEVVRAGLRALDREDEAVSQVMRARIDQALADPRPDISLEDAFDRLETRHAERMKSSGRDA